MKMTKESINWITKNAEDLPTALCLKATLQRLQRQQRKYQLNQLYFILRFS